MRSMRDRWLIAGVVIAGLACWFAYCAVQPHDFWSSANSDSARATIFGWDAPGIPASSSSVPDRLWIAMVGWALVSFIAGWLCPRRWLVVGVCTVMPTWIVYFPTAPRDNDGMWGTGIIVLPMTVVGYAFIAWMSGKLRGTVAPMA